MDGEVWDAVVVGGGTAGLSAATWLGRYRRRCLVVDRGEPRNRWVDESHGYLGSDGTSPGELLDRARSDLRRYRTVTSSACGVVAVRGSLNAFAVETDHGGLLTRRLVLATGAADVLPSIEGLSTHYGADVVLCPACDGYEAEGLVVAVLGWGPQIPGFARHLLDWAASVVVLTMGRVLEADAGAIAEMRSAGIDVVDEQPVALVGPRGGLRGISLADGSVVRCERAFASVEVRPACGLALQLGCALEEGGYVHVDPSGATTVPGVYAAGDCTPGPQLVQVAAAEGAVAGIACARSLA